MASPFKNRRHGHWLIFFHKPHCYAVCFFPTYDIFHLPDLKLNSEHILPILAKVPYLPAVLLDDEL